MLTDLVRELVRNNQKFETILDFIESPLGANLTLFPIQKFVLKMMFGIPLSKTTKFDVCNETRTRVLYTLSEVDYLKFLHSEGRCNHETDPQNEFREVIWRGGRRSSKSTTMGLVACWIIYRLLQLEDPHSYYNILSSTDIRIANVANTKKQNEIFYGEVVANLRSKDFFNKYIFPSKSENSVRLFTKKEFKMVEDGYKPPPSIILDAVTCNSSSARGGNNIAVFLDEFAHYSKVLKSSRSDTEIYDSITPSVGSFGNDGRVYIMSTPLGPSGKMHSLTEQAKKDLSFLSLEIPSWEINVNLIPAVLEDRLKRSRNSFMREFGARYVASVSDFIEDEAILDLSKRDFNTVYVHPKKSYYFYYGMDLGFVNDPTAISISHVENKRVLVDYCEALKPGEGRYIGHIHLDHDVVIKRLKELFLEYPPFKGMYDQWEGYGFDMSLKKAGVHHFELWTMTDSLNSQIYKTFYSLLCSGALFMNKNMTALFEELLHLQKEVKNKFMIKVEAPSVSGMHDDMSDATARSIYLAYNSGILQDAPEIRYISERDQKTRILADYARRIRMGRL